MEDVFNRPGSEFIADFVGANILEGKVKASEAGGSTVGVNGFNLVCSGEAKVGSVVRVAIRPENIVVTKESPADPSASNALTAVLEGVLNEGQTCVLHLRSCETVLNVLVANNALERLDLREGDDVYAMIRHDNVKIV